MQIGQTVGQYLITAFLGEGAMGKVFRGRDTQLSRDVAIKVLRPEISSRPDLMERFRNEAMTLASLHHGNICSVYAFVEHDGQHAMVLQHLEGRPLEDILREQGRQDWPETRRILRDVLSGLQEAHAAQIVHRDLKPANLMVTPSRKVVIMDFGIARARNQQRATREGMMVGTLEYASPEQIRGEDVDARSDLYSLGIIAYEMLIGRLPFDAKTDYEWVKAQTTEDPDFSAVAEQHGRAVAQFLRKTLEKSAARRFDSARDMDAALESIKESARPTLPGLGLGQVVQETAASLSAVTQRSSGLLALVRDNLVMFVAGALVLVGLGFVALTHLQRPAPTSPAGAPAVASTPVQPPTTPPSAPVQATAPVPVQPAPVDPPRQPEPVTTTASPTPAQQRISTPAQTSSAGKISTGTEGGGRNLEADAARTEPAAKPARERSGGQQGFIISN